MILLCCEQKTVGAENHQSCSRVSISQPPPGWASITSHVSSQLASETWLCHIFWKKSTISIHFLWDLQATQLTSTRYHHSYLCFHLGRPNVNSWALHLGHLTSGPQLIARSRSLAPDPPQSKHARPPAARRVFRRAPIQSLQNIIMYICRFRATCKHAPRASDIPSLQKWSQKSMIGPCLLRILGVKCLGCLDLETNFWHWSLCCRPSHILSCLRCTSPVRFHMRRLPSCFSLGMFQRLSLASCSWCRSGAPGAGISCHPWWLRFCLGFDARMPVQNFMPSKVYKIPLPSYVWAVVKTLKRNQDGHWWPWSPHANSHTLPMPPSSSLNWDRRANAHRSTRSGDTPSCVGRRERGSEDISTWSRVAGNGYYDQKNTDGNIQIMNVYLIQEAQKRYVNYWNRMWHHQQKMAPAMR